MKKLLYAPIIHTSADLGSLATGVTKRGIADLGKDIWEEHGRTVDGFWDAISRYFNSINVSGMKIYQDGMVAEGEIGEKIVAEGVKSGSKNYKLVSSLLKKGALLVKTEDFNLVKAEFDRLRKITQAKKLAEKLFAFVKYKATKDALLKKRDNFIAKRITETLNHGETGILFIGAYHKVRKKLPGDMLVREIKDTRKIEEYQRLLPFYDRNKKRFNELKGYLISEVK